MGGHSKMGSSSTQSKILSPGPRVTCRVQNQDIPRAGRGGVAHGGAAERGWAGRGADVSVRPADSRPFCPPGPPGLQGIADNCPERSFGSTKKQNPMQTDGGTRVFVCGPVPGISETCGALNFAFASQSLLLKDTGRLMHLHRSGLYF